MPFVSFCQAMIPWEKGASQLRDVELTKEKSHVSDSAAADTAKGSHCTPFLFQQEDF